MSLIYAQVDFGSGTIERSVKLRNEKIEKNYKFDVFKEFENKNVYMSCHQLKITPESADETIPFIKNDEKIYITADAIIDNRQELFRKLDLEEIGPKVTDVEMIFYAYKKWGEDCATHLIGDFSFVILDQKEKKLIAVRDHVGKRPLYFKRKSGRIEFASTMHQLVDSDHKLNEQWIADFLTLQGVSQECDIPPTIYEGVYELRPAELIVVSNEHDIKQKIYWDPSQIKPRKFKNHQACIDELREIFDEAVKCRLRVDGNVGLMLSSGLDSVAIADTVGNLKDVKQVYTYTSVPEFECQESLPKWIVADESEWVKDLTNQYDNLSSEWIKSEGKHSLSDIDRLLEIYEHPYKLTNNVYWIDALHKKASEQGVKVLLNGQYGNSTISYGDAIDYFKWLYEKKRFVKFLIALRKHYRHKKQRYRNALYENIKSILAMRHIEDQIVEDTLLNKRLQRKYKEIERLKSFGHYSYGYIGHRDYIKKITMGTMLTQIGSMEAKMGHHYGIISRDPTMDKRVIEFCFSLPDHFFFKEGYDRYIARAMMSDKVPNEIRWNVNYRGMQSSDWVQRLKASNVDLSELVENALEDEQMKYYFDRNHIRKIINDEELSSMTLSNKQKLKELILTIIFNRYIKNQSEEVEV